MPDVYALQPFLPAARASTPVWRDSATKPVKWQPMSKKAAAKLWHRARVFERGTRQPGRQDGALGRNGLAVLHALIFDCLNYATGRLDPAINTVARLACISPRSAARGLAALKLAGVLDWVRRCRESIEDGRFTLRQESNAYAVLPPSNWLAYVPPLEPSRPQPGTWGDHPSMPGSIVQAAATIGQGGCRADVLRELEADPGDGLAAALARLGRALRDGSDDAFSGLPAWQ
jgi:hypothetical protein